MRKYLLPLAVFAAIGAVIIILVKSGEDAPPPPREPTEVNVEPEPNRGTDDPFPLKRRKTRTPLERHRGLSELERALGREDLSHAYFFRSQVCTDLDTILADGELTANLLHAIRTFGVESDDLRRRDVVLPILRVLKHPEATKIIAAEYYKARSEEERGMLLEAMSHAYHDPEQASVWAVERALNAEAEEVRIRSVQVIERFTANPELIYRTATQIYESTTRPEQRLDMFRVIGDQASASESAREWLRKKLVKPHPDEIGAVLGALGGWVDENDAALLETLAVEYPALGDVMRDRARDIRRVIREQAGEEPEPEPEPKLEPEPEEEPEEPRDE
jgi:hypothetical protein